MEEALNDKIFHQNYFFSLLETRKHVEKNRIASVFFFSHTLNIMT